ncbi:uncharacterized protein si:ch73-140j24.4 isoform X3 [Clupea harengus]|uniref:Uncharacterized protein si:ch73-140j24.4 isoform X3 n=1 Tax=Clupea harengus TaxID=7950 RepID=A0A6P8F2Q5_CLUHA|nr:uncharacterized protein si:ch73-140j24.4 isoform X3 [Clupea harengus]
MMRFILDCLRPTRQRAGERDISLEKVAQEKDETSNQQNDEIQELQEEMTREEVGLKEEQVQCHEAHEALEKLAEQRAELKIQIESIQQRRKEERQLLLSLQEEQEELEHSVHEYEEEFSRAQEELHRLQEDITQAERKVEGARVCISPLQNSISQSYAEISRVGVSLAQQRLGELIAELIAVEGPVTIGVSHQQGEESHTEDCTEGEQEEEEEEEEQEEEGEQEELSEQDLQLYIADDEEPCGESNREEEPDRPNPADNLSSGSSSFTEITLTEVKEEEGSSPRSITPQQIDSPDLEEEEEEVLTVQSLMTQTSSHTTIGPFDFYHPDPFTDNDLFRDDLFPKVEVADSTEGFFSDPFKGTDPFASDYLFGHFEEEQNLPIDHLTDREHEPKPEPELCVPECTTNMDREYSDAGYNTSNGMELHAEEEFDSIALNPSSDGLETRGECDGFEISVPACSESSHTNYPPGDLADQNSYFTRPESNYAENPGPLELRDPNPLSVDLSDEGWESEGLESNDSCPLNVDGDDVGQRKPMECALSSPRASEVDRCDPEGSERSGSPLTDVVKCSLAESKRQVRRHFSCEANMALSIETPDATPGCPEPFCPVGNDRNGWQFEDSEVCDENHFSVESSQRMRGSVVAPKFSDQEMISRNLNNSRNCDGCVFELCHHYPTDTDTVDMLRTSREGTEFRDCVSINSQENKTGNCNSEDYELVEHDPFCPINDDKYDTDGARIYNHNHYSPDHTSSGKQENTETQYRYPDPFSPEQNDDVHFNFSGSEDMEHNILVPVSMSITSCDAGSFDLKTGDPFSPDPVHPISINANGQQVTNLDPCHLDPNNIFSCDSTGSKHADCELFSSEPNDRPSCASNGCELMDPEAPSYQYSVDCPKSAQNNCHIPDFNNITDCGNFNSESGDIVSHNLEPKDKLIINPEPSEFRCLNSLSPEPNSDSDVCHLRGYDSGCYDTSKTVRCDLRPPELMQFDPFSPEPSDAEMCDVGSEGNHCSQSAFFETASNGPSQFSSWGLEPSMFSSELVERCEYTPTGTSSDDSVKGHPFDSESSETAGWSLSESETSRPTDQNPEYAREKTSTCSDFSEQDGCCSELNKVARSSRHSSVPDSIAEMLFGPELSAARFYPWDFENSNTIVCDNHSPEDSPDTLRCEFGLVSGYDINSSVAVNSGASEVPNLR